MYLKRSLQEPVVSTKKQKQQIEDIDSLEARALNFGGRVYSKLRALGLVDKYIQAGGRTFIRYRLSKNYLITLSSKLYTLNPKPQTLNLKP